jgi:hypothetical protein
MSLHRRARVVAVGLAALLLLPAGLGPAAAQEADGTIVFIRDGQVVIGRPDGSEVRQVTDQGVWRGPSMDDRGVIAAVRDEHTVVRMTQDGQVLSEVVPQVIRSAGAVEAILDPAGELIAYTTLEDCSTGDLFIVCRNGVIIRADDPAGAPISNAGGVEDPAWLPDGRLALRASGDLVTMTPGQDDSAPWAEDAAFDDRPGISRDGAFMAGPPAR